MTVANKTTTIEDTKTVGEIQSMLATAGATSVMIHYVNARPESIAFKLVSGSGPIAFILPANWKGILSAMKRDPHTPIRLIYEDQARRVSWRVVRDWLRAQLTMISAGGATLEEVMLPWAVTNDGSTVSKRLLSEERTWRAISIGDR